MSAQSANRSRIFIRIPTHIRSTTGPFPSAHSLRAQWAHPNLRTFGAIVLCAPSNDCLNRRSRKRHAAANCELTRFMCACSPKSRSASQDSPQRCTLCRTPRLPSNSREGIGPARAMNLSWPRHNSPFGLRLVIAKVRVTSSCNIRRRDRSDRRRRFASAAIPLENLPPLKGGAVPATAAAGMFNAHRCTFTSFSNFPTSSQTCHDVVEINVECGRKPVQSEC